MEVFESLDAIKIDRPVCLALGNFDGFHRGHMRLIERCLDISKEKDIASAAFVFNELTLNAIRGTNEIKTLIPKEIRDRKFEELGFDYLISIPFEKNIMELLPEAFFTKITDAAKVSHLVCGFNYTFGHKATGNTCLLRTLAESRGVGLDVIEEVSANGMTVSSTLLRHLLEEGRVEDYDTFADGPFTLYGISLHNGGDCIAVDGTQAVPADGLYKIFCEASDRCFYTEASVTTSETASRRLFIEELADNDNIDYGDVKLEFYRRLTVK